MSTDTRHFETLRTLNDEGHRAAGWGISGSV